MIHPCILCGGSGTRLWPLSRKSYPKQFVAVTGEETLFQATARRLSGICGTEPLAPPLILTHADFRFIASQQLGEAGIEAGTILLEPESHNTAPAVLVAALQLQACDPEAVLLVAPSDHRIPDAAAFRAAVARGLPALAKGRIVTFGIRPVRAETGYGWLELNAEAEGTGDGPAPLARFVEKPAPEEAAAMLRSNRFLWNAGIFLFRAADMIAAFEAHAPALIAPVRAALAGATLDLDFLRLAAAPWKATAAISLDYAVMEPARNLSVVPYAGSWSDLGTWDAVWSECARDACGTGCQGTADAIDCENSLLRSDSAEVRLVGIGLRDVMAIATRDAVLVAHRSRTQEVGAAVALLHAQGAQQATQLHTDHRPWGRYECLSKGDRFQVKRIHVRPGGMLSLQSHHHRAEHWIVVEGTAKVTIDGETRLLSENQSVYVPLGAVHRMENPGKVPVVLIEVQTGAYLGEDDIIRYEDLYAREAQPEPERLRRL